MNLLFIGDLYPPEVVSGYELICHQLVREMRQRGHRLEVLTGRNTQNTYHADSHTGIHRILECQPQPDDEDGQAEARAKVAKGNYQRVLDRLNADDLSRVDMVVAWSLKDLSLAPLYAAKKAKLPMAYVMLDEHALVFMPPGQKAKLSPFKRLAHRFLPNFQSLQGFDDLPIILSSRAQRHHLRSRGLRSERTYIVPQGLQLHRHPYRPCRRHIGEPWRLLYMGPVTWGQGIETLIEAMALLKRGRHAIPLSLSFVGMSEASFRQQIIERARQGGFAQSLNFVGNLPPFARINAFHRHHLTIFTGFDDGPFGLTQLQAMASGSVLISTSTGRSAEWIRDGQNALAFHHGSPEALAQQIARLTQDEIFRLALSSRARKYIEDHANFATYVDEIEATLGHIYTEFHRNRSISLGFSTNIPVLTPDESDNLELIPLN